MSRYFCKKTGEPVQLKPADVLLYRWDSAIGAGIALFSWSRFTHVGLCVPANDSQPELYRRNWVIDANPPTVQIRTLSYDLLHSERKIAVYRTKNFDDVWQPGIYWRLKNYLAGQIDTKPYGYKTIASHAWLTIKSWFGAKWPEGNESGTYNPPICSELVSEFFKNELAILIKPGTPCQYIQPADFAKSAVLYCVTPDLSVNIQEVK